MDLDDHPRVPLLFGPSPIHPLKRLSEALGGEVEIWAKRAAHSQHEWRHPADEAGFDSGHRDLWKAAVESAPGLG